jgi:signal peptidase I
MFDTDTKQPYNSQPAPEQRRTPDARPDLKRPGFLDEIIRTLILVIVVTVLFDMAIPRSLVDGQSMRPTFEDSERLIVSRVHYLLAPPNRGDVIVLNSLDEVREPNVMLIKRVLGLPGDTVRFRNQQLYINGEPVEEPYINDGVCRYSCPDREWLLEPDEYFVMGDNRDHSNDSRSFGPVPIDHIVGHVIFRYWPPRRIGIVGEREYNLSAPQAGLLPLDARSASTDSTDSGG